MFDLPKRLKVVSANVEALGPVSVGAYLLQAATEAEAIAAWNTRAAPDVGSSEIKPMAWMYVRRPEAWPPSAPVLTLERWDEVTRDRLAEYWTETPLVAAPDIAVLVEAIKGALQWDKDRQRTRAEQAEAEVGRLRESLETMTAQSLGQYDHAVRLRDQIAAMQAAIVEAVRRAKEEEAERHLRHAAPLRITKPLAPFIPQGPDMPTDGHHPAEGFQQIADYIAPAIQAQT